MEGRVEWDMAPHHLCLWTSSNSDEARARKLVRDLGGDNDEGGGGSGGVEGGAM